MKHLDQLKIQSPCPKKWADFSGSDGRRYCDSCSKHVYNLSSMSRLEAEALLRLKRGDLCVAYRMTKEGKIRNASLWNRVRWVPAGLLAALVSLFPIGCAGPVRSSGKDAAAAAACPAPATQGQEEMLEMVGDTSNYMESSSGKIKSSKK